MTQEQMITLDQAVPISGISPATLRRAIRAGKLIATRAEEDGYSYRIDPAELQRFMATRVCLVCGKALTGAYQRKLCPECRVARVKNQLEAKLSDPVAHAIYYAKRRVLKDKPSYKSKARVAGRKRRSNPDVKEARNAPRRKHPVQFDAHVGAYHQANPQMKSHEQWMRRKNDPVALAEHNRRRAEKRTAKKQAHAEKWKGGSIAEAKAFLLQKLAKGPRPAEEITRQAKTKGISARTLRRARQDLGVVIEKPGYQGPSMWRLPKD
jgi:Helix-turn-helix domain